MRKFVLAFAIAATSLPTLAADDEFNGTYTLISATRKVLDTGEVVDAYGGPNPKGSIMYGRDGRFMVLVTFDRRPKPESLAKMTDQERADLLRSLVSYGGTYTYHGDRIEHHIDVSWNETWTGTTIIGDIKKEGDKVIYTTRPAPFSSDGKISVVTNVLEKIASLPITTNNNLSGTVRVVSSKRQILDSGELVDTYGPHPTGYVMFGGGRMISLIAYDGRPKPANVETMTDQQRTALFRTMLSYTGPFTWDGTKMEHHIEASWNEVWTGTTVIREGKFEGDRLTYSTRPAPFSGDGKMSVVTNVFEWVK